MEVHPIFKNKKIKKRKKRRNRKKRKKRNTKLRHCGQDESPREIGFGTAARVVRLSDRAGAYVRYHAWSSNEAARRGELRRSMRLRTSRTHDEHRRTVGK